MAEGIVDGIVTLVAAGFDGDTVLHEWPYDRFRLFSKAARRRELENRKDFVMDVAAAVSGILTGKGLKEHIKGIDETRDRNK